jgi:hypothetical protein
MFRIFKKEKRKETKNQKKTEKKNHTKKKKNSVAAALMGRPSTVPTRAERGSVPLTRGA